MKKNVMIFFMLLPICVAAQELTGIKFRETAGWKQTLEYAKKENKNIFVDANATWCGPCKMMDAKVFTDKNVAQYANGNFLSVKIQMDKTSADSKEIKEWYTDAEDIQSKYQVNAMPSYLFFDPNGRLLHRSMGYLNPEEFLSLLKVANDPGKSYAGRVKSYKSGKLKGVELLTLSLSAKEYNDDSLAVEIAQKYKKEVLDISSPSVTVTPALYDFLNNFMNIFKVGDKVVTYIYKNKTLVDSIFRKRGYSTNMADYLITKDILNTVIKSSKQMPDWSGLESKIRSQFDKTTSKRVIVNSKLDWYSSKNDYQKMIEYNLQKLEIVGVDTVGLAKAALNNMIYELIFQHSNDPAVLHKAAGYMEILIQTNPHRDTWLDTYANLLYKLGKKEESIKYEQKALAIAQSRQSKSSMLEYEATLKKMQNNEPTWGVPASDGK